MYLTRWSEQLILPLKYTHLSQVQFFKREQKSHELVKHFEHCEKGLLEYEKSSNMFHDINNIGIRYLQKINKDLMHSLVI